MYFLHSLKIVRTQYCFTIWIASVAAVGCQGAAISGQKSTDSADTSDTASVLLTENDSVSDNEHIDADSSSGAAGDFDTADTSTSRLPATLAGSDSDTGLSLPDSGGDDGSALDTGTQFEWDSQTEGTMHPPLCDDSELASDTGFSGIDADTRQQATTDSDTVRDADTVPYLPVDTNTNADTHSDWDTRRDTACDDTATDAGIDTASALSLDTGTETGTIPVEDTNVNPDTETEFCFDTETDTGTASRPDTETVSESESGDDTEFDSGTDSGSVFDSNTTADTDTGSVFDSDTTSDMDTGSVFDSDTSTETTSTETDTDSETDSETDTEDTDSGTDTGYDERIPAIDPITCLRDAGSRADPPLLIGAAIAGYHLDENWGYKNTAVSEFNYVTAENEMKWDQVEPSPNWFNFSPGDHIVDFALANQMAVKGHCLVWHSQLPGWVEQLHGREITISAMKRHIEQMMSHYSGRVTSWDVVNEAVTTDTNTGDTNARMRETVFYNEIGDDYIDIAFHHARAQDPTAKLYYNDYSIDGLNAKSDFVYTMIADMLDRGVPIDGVGFQMHIGPPNNIPTADEVVENFRRFTDLGIEILISEMDINLCGDLITQQQQWDLYHNVVQACFNNVHCTAITFWGINDGYSWLNDWSTARCNGQNSRSLLFNDYFQKKQTYYEVLDALSGY